MEGKRLFQVKEVDTVKTEVRVICSLGRQGKDRLVEISRSLRAG
jgi:hypothetical protein